MRRSGMNAMVNAAIAIVLVSVWTMSTAVPAVAASIRNVYFSNGDVVRGQIYRSVGELPGATKEFTKGKDKVARLFVIFGDLDGHKMTGDLKAADGKAVSRMDRDVGPYSGSVNLSWRLATHGFNLERLEPGEYQFELSVDGSSVGSYAFTLR